MENEETVSYIVEALATVTENIERYIKQMGIEVIDKNNQETDWRPRNKMNIKGTVGRM